jgi:mono/diheme cytochrome c family protein
MKSRRVLTLLAVGTFSSGLFAAERLPAAAALEERFNQLDRNHDGRLTREEAGDAPWFDRFDRRGDGVITLEQIRAISQRLGADRPRPSAEGQAEIPIASPAPADAAPVDSPRVGPRIVKPSERGIGRLIPDFTFTDIEGRPGRLANLQPAKAVVIALTSTSCPITKKFAPTLARIEQEFAGRGVRFLFVNPTATDDLAGIREVVRENRFVGPYVRDRDHRIAGVLDAQTTTEVFVLDAARTLVFRGAVDDQYGLGYALEAPRMHYLRDALTAIIEKRIPAVAATEAPGCVLDLKADRAVVSEELTYHNRISRIVQQNCVECHRDGGVAPFSLQTYDEIREHAGMMRRQVSRGAMPPWFAAPPAAGEPSLWKNDRALSASDKADLLAWLAGEKTVGNPADAALPRPFPTGWAIGTPDAVIELPREVAIKADGVMPYQTLTVETTFTEDKWIAAYEVQPTAREVVHHVILKVIPKNTVPDASRDREVAEAREGFFAAYVPGNGHAIFPAGFGKLLPAGATVKFQMHYTPNGEATTDRTRLGLVFAAAPPRHVIHVIGLLNVRLQIPPGASNHPETTGLTLPFDATLLGFLPHMHVRGKAARYEATLPDGTRRTLLDVPAYDFNWQLQYQFAEPVTLPRGTRLIYTAWYDNSPDNPANPDPAKLVRWGPQTFDEMMLGYVEYYVPGRPTLARTDVESGAP